MQSETVNYLMQFQLGQQVFRMHPQLQLNSHRLQVQSQSNGQLRYTMVEMHLQDTVFTWIMVF